MQLPRMVVAHLRGRSLPEHPDPDLLTAFAEHKLLAREQAQVLHHLGSCDECRHVVVLAQPEAAPETSRVLAQGGRSWLAIPVLRWGALAASILVVAATVLIHQYEQPARRAQTEVAVQQHAAPAAPAAPVREEPEQLAGPQASNEMKKSGRPAARKQNVPQELASAKRDQPAPPALPGLAGASVADTQRSEQSDMQAEAASPQASPGSQPQKTLAANSSAAAKAAPAFTPRPARETAASTMGGAATFTDLRPPTWRLSQDGLPERSFSSGQWEKVQVDHQKGFRALASLGMEVWLGGAAGLLYHSEDMGMNWTRMIPITSSGTLTDDISGISFTDHLHGELRTAAGQTWVTSDAGKTWQRQ